MVCDAAIKQINTRRYAEEFEDDYDEVLCYGIVLLKRLPDEGSKKPLIQTVENVISEYSEDIDLKLIGFPENYMEIMENNL